MRGTEETKDKKGKARAKETPTGHRELTSDSFLFLVHVLVCNPMIFMASFMIIVPLLSSLYHPPSAVTPNAFVPSPEPNQK